MKPKVILYNPRSNAAGKRILPLSLLALGAVLEGRYDYTLVDGNCEPDPLAMLRAQIHNGANVLAVTVMPGPQLAQAVPHCRALKNEFARLTVVWGGYFPTQHADACLRAPYVDLVIRGYGEMGLLALLDALALGTNHRTIAGLAHREQDGRVVQNAPGPMPHPGNLPAYPYHRLEMERYIRRTFLGSRTLGHHTSYGCPHGCNFCAVVNMAHGRWLARPAQQVAEVARLYAQQWGVNAIEFYDNNFFVHEARSAEFAERILLMGLAWWAEGRVDTLLGYADQTWQLMADSGLKMAFMGAESGSAETLACMDKGGTLTPEMTLAIAAKMRVYRIVPEFSFVLGTPPDPERDIHETISFIRRLKAVNPASEIVLYPYTPVPLGGELYDAAQKAGFRFPTTLEEWVSPEWIAFAERRNGPLSWLPQRLRQRILDFQRVLNAYYPTRTTTRLARVRGAITRAASAWRYHTGIYGFPLELRLLGKILPYQRPETSGF